MIPPMGIKVFITFLVFLFHFVNLEARPISYSGGSTLMMESNNMQDSAYYHYSPTYKYSVGIQQIKDKYFNSNYSYLRLTYLLNRRNTKNSHRETFTSNLAYHPMAWIIISMEHMEIGRLEAIICRIWLQKNYDEDIGLI